MNLTESINATATELTSIARAHGHDVGALCTNGVFLRGERCIFCWRTDNSVAYNMQGRIQTLPKAFHQATGALGQWSESGIVPDIVTALDLLTAWLIEVKEVDQLGTRQPLRRGIG